jgi:predicted NBD/HSP70 family sugar kinase
VLLRPQGLHRDLPVGARPRPRLRSGRPRLARRRGDRRAGRGGSAGRRAALERYAGRFARAIASVINLLDPDVVVVGGGLSNLERLYERVPALWGEYVFSDQVVTRLVRAKHGDTSGVRGAAWLWD